MRFRRPRLKRPPVRNVDIGDLQDTFLVCAVATILIIRLQLWLTNYPQLGGGKLHIAHLLWGGVGMLIALTLLLSFVGRSLRAPAAVVGGIGFGFFIDELGKFITSDNDYFYKPTAALIYVVFILLFFAARAMRRRRGFSPREYLVNAMDLATEAARHDLDEREKRRALEMISHADPADPLVRPLRELLHHLDALPPREPRRVTRWALAVRGWYFRLVERRWFAKVIGWVFALWAFGSILTLVGVVLRLGFALDGRNVGAAADRLADRAGDLSFINVCSVTAPVVAAALVAIGVAQLGKGERLDAYRWFDRALLVQIFITQVFAFVVSEFSAVFGLGVDILLLVTVRAMIRGERHLRRAAGPVAPGPPSGEPAPADEEAEPAPA